MKIKILFFGQLSEIINASELELLAINNTDELNKKLFDLYPKLEDMKFSLAINKKIIHENTPLNNEDIVALLPPFSGG
jgi:molybdopterin synthase sulfur carrier subunit